MKSRGEKGLRALARYHLLRETRERERRKDQGESKPKSKKPKNLCSTREISILLWDAEEKEEAQRQGEYLERDNCRFNFRGEYFININIAAHYVSRYENKGNIV